MRERALPLPLTIVLLACLALLSTPLAALGASGLPPTISMQPTAAGPGSTVEIVGLDFPTSTAVEVLLTTTAGAVPLGTAATDEGGYFRYAVTFPADIAPGFWELRGTAPDGAIAVYIFEAVVDPQPANVSDPAAANATSAAATAGSGGTNVTDMVVMLIMAVLVAGIVTAAIYVWRTTHRKDGDPGMPSGDDPIWSGASSKP